MQSVVVVVVEVAVGEEVEGLGREGRGARGQERQRWPEMVAAAVPCPPLERTR